MGVTTNAAVGANFGSDAEFRSFGAALSAAIVDGGHWTRVYQNFATGTDWSLVSQPSAFDDVEVTEVYALADAEQAATPLFFKIRYAEGNSSLPRLHMEVGTAHDGAGNLTANVRGFPAAMSPGSSSSGVTMRLEVSAHSGGLTICLGRLGSAAVTGAFIALGRLRDREGNKVAGKLFIATSQTADNSALGAYSFDSVAGWVGLGGSSTGKIAFLDILNTGGHQRTLGGDYPIFPAVFVHGGNIYFAKEIIAYVLADLASGSGVPVTLLGQPEVILPVGAAFQTTSFVSSNYGLAMPWA